jgi:purine nucleoside permease
VGALTTVAGDDPRSALLGADGDARVKVDAEVMIDTDSDEGPAEDEEEDDDSDAVDDATECSALDPLD